MRMMRGLLEGHYHRRTEVRRTKEGTVEYGRDRHGAHTVRSYPFLIHVVSKMKNIVTIRLLLLLVCVSNERFLFGLQGSGHVHR